MNIPVELKPLAIVLDPGAGQWSGGDWVAVGGYDQPAVTSHPLDRIGSNPSRMRVVHDALCCDGGQAEPGDFMACVWTGVGSTPDEAIQDLVQKFTDWACGGRRCP